RADDRDAAADGAFEREVHAALNREVHEARSVLGEQELVGRDHALPGLDRALDEAARGILAAHDLDDQIDGRIGDDLFRRGRQEAAIALGDALFREIADQDALYLEGRADA